MQCSVEHSLQHLGMQYRGTAYYLTLCTVLQSCREVHFINTNHFLAKDAENYMWIYRNLFSNSAGPFNSGQCSSVQ